jgi:hypothetical protein
LILLVGALVACERNALAPLPPVQVVPTGGLTVLTVPTYDGSGQAVHPDIMNPASPWGGWEYWLAFTPYPLSNEAYENASVVVSHDGVQWQVPPGMTNPLSPRGNGILSNSDPDLFLMPGAERLALLYREVTETENIIMLRTTADGVTWTTPEPVLRGPREAIVSPTAVVQGSNIAVWYVDAGYAGCSTRSSTVRVQSTRDMHRWSPAMATDLQQPGRVVWHLDVTWVPDRQEYWAVYPAYPVGSTCSHSDLYMARSRDGRHWEGFDAPVWESATVVGPGGTLYRSSLEYDAATQGFTVWISAHEANGAWTLRRGAVVLQ